MQKVFGIGFQKTGTKSLAVALSALGYKVTGPNGTKDPDIADKIHAMVDELLPQYDAFQDNPWPVLYQELDRKCPGSKFILTIRDTEDWIRSVVRYFGSDDSPMREWIYGVGHPLGHEDVYRERYERHNREVREYLADRPDDLLVMDLAAGDGWEKLCGFLGHKIPDKPFPRVNRAEGIDDEYERAAKKPFWKRLLGR